MTQLPTQLDEITSRAARCAIASLGVLSATAATVWLSGLADETRALLGLRFMGAERSPAVAASIALHNARIVAGTLLCAHLAPRLLTRARVLVDVALALMLAFNATAVGLALGAYGTRTIRTTALHLPLELGALSLAGGAYMQACTRPLTVRATAIVATVGALLLIAAAALETYSPLTASR